jgi:O-antigen ligase
MLMTKTVSQRRSIDSRLSKWNETIRIFRDHPVFGTGSGTYGLMSYRYNLADKSRLSPLTTNTFLQLLMEKGVVGFVAYMGAIGAICMNALKLVRERSISAIIFLSAMVALLVREMTFSSMLEQHIVLSLFFLIALCCTFQPIKT